MNVASVVSLHVLSLCCPSLFHRRFFCGEHTQSLCHEVEPSFSVFKRHFPLPQDVHKFCYTSYRPCATFFRYENDVHFAFIAFLPKVFLQGHTYSSYLVSIVLHIRYVYAIRFIAYYSFFHPNSTYYTIFNKYLRGFGFAHSSVMVSLKVNSQKGNTILCNSYFLTDSNGTRD